MTPLNKKKQIINYLDNIDNERLNALYNFIKPEIEAHNIWTKEFVDEMERRSLEAKRNYNTTIDGKKAMKQLDAIIKKVSSGK